MVSLSSILISGPAGFLIFNPENISVADATIDGNVLCVCC